MRHTELLERNGTYPPLNVMYTRKYTTRFAVQATSSGRFLAQTRTLADIASTHSHRKILFSFRCLLWAEWPLKGIAGEQNSLAVLLACDSSCGDDAAVPIGMAFFLRPATAYSCKLLACKVARISRIQEISKCVEVNFCLELSWICGHRHVPLYICMHVSLYMDIRELV